MSDEAPGGSERRRFAVVTGGGGGMGLECARRLAPRFRLVLADVDAARVERARAALATDGVEAVGRPLDVSDRAAVRSLADLCSTQGEFGALVHTAGLSPTMASGERIWEVNLVGTAYLMEAFRPLVGPGSVAVLVASQAGHMAREGATPELDALVDDPLSADLIERARSRGLLDPGAAYAASKYGVMRLASREAFAWGERGGRVVSLSPGIIDTGMGRQEYAAQPIMETIVAKGALPRMGRADEIAAAVEFLCSERASFVTATDLLVDGGSTEGLRRLR